MIYCLQYERVFKIFYFHMQNLAKSAYGWSPLEQHGKVENKITGIND
jgi:hypothetical protein